MSWTHFWDMHSGGSQKLAWAHIFIEAPEDEARKLFAEAFGRHPDNETCNCCGGDYAVSEEPSLEQATGHHRHLRYASPLSEGAWQTATAEERRHANEVGRYLEPDEPLPDGWHYGWHNPVVAEHHQPMTMAEFLADPHFDDFGKRREVKILARPAQASAATEGGEG